MQTLTLALYASGLANPGIEFVYRCFHAEDEVVRISHVDFTGKCLVNGMPFDINIPWDWEDKGERVWDSSKQVNYAADYDLRIAFIELQQLLTH